ncbi:MAG: hypothetical protein RL417_107 [Pseudomonadota bacterium]|jgi:predicted Rossmann-fold nucleotide-binding protein
MSGDFAKPGKSEINTTTNGAAAELGGGSMGNRDLHISEVFSEYALLLLGGNNAMKVLDSSSLKSLSYHFNTQDIYQLLDRYKASPMICVNGTARDVAVNPEMREFNEALARRLVADGVGLVCGGAETGAMGASIKAFRLSRDSYQQMKGHEAPAEIATVTLKLMGEHANYEPPADLSRHGKASEPQDSWLNRTLALHAVGRQLVQLMEPGGAGTIFELRFQLVNRQLKDKGPVGVFDAARPPSQIVLVSSALPDGADFWQPTVDQIKEMERCGAIKSTESLIHHFGAHQLHEAVNFISEVYQQNLQSIGSRVMNGEDRRYAKKAVDSLMESGMGPRDITAEVDNKFLALLDNIVATHRTVYHLRETMARFGRGDVAGADAYLESVKLSAPSERVETLAAIKRFSDKPAVYLCGSAKDIWNEQLEAFSETVIEGAVRRGHTIVIDGKGTDGMAGKWSEMWAEKMTAYERECGVSSKSELVRVQLAYTGEEIPARKLAGGYTETVLPAVLNVETKTAVAASIGSKRAFVLAPGGHAEMFAFDQIYLDSQLAGSIRGIYNSKEERPIIEVLNVPGKPGHQRFYDPTIRQLHAMVDAKTISPGDLNLARFDSLHNPVQSALDLLAKLG